MKKNPNFVKHNKCPYCTYPYDYAGMIDDKRRPESGDLFFCLMCCQPSILDKQMDMVKFDLNSIDNIVERNRLKIISLKMQEFWVQCPDDNVKKRREKYLKVYDEQTKS